MIWFDTAHLSPSYNGERVLLQFPKTGSLLKALHLVRERGARLRSWTAGVSAGFRRASERMIRPSIGTGVHNPCSPGLNWQPIERKPQTAEDSLALQGWSLTGVPFFDPSDKQGLSVPFMMCGVCRKLILPVIRPDRTSVGLASDRCADTAEYWPW